MTKPTLRHLTDFRFPSLAALTILILAGCAAKRVETTEMKTAAPPPPPSEVKKEDTLKIASDTKGNEAPVARFDGATIHFEFDQSVLRPDGTEALQKLADLMRANPAMKVHIEGHSDERGTTEYNLALGSKRAAVAKKYLVTLGVDESRISTVSFGEEVPAVQATTEDAHAANRRDVISPR